MRYNIKYIIIVMLFSLWVSVSVYGQENQVGSWSLSSVIESDNYEYKNYKFVFNKIGIDELILLDDGEIDGPGSDVYAVFTGGAYNCIATDLDFYVMGKYYFYGNEFGEWEESGSFTHKLQSDFQIIKSLNDDYSYQMLYTQNYGGGTANYHTKFHIVDVGIINEEISFDREVLNLDHPATTEGSNDDVGFIISNLEINEGEKYLYIVTGNGDYQPNVGNFGLQKYIIDDNGVEFEETILNELDSDIFEFSDFRAYNLEMQNKTENENPIFAWTNNPNPGVNSKVFIYHPDGEYIIDLSLGAIGGLEFSPFENEEQFLYLSCEDEGIVKLNYINSTYTVVTGTEDFAHTYLQTAPDGNIYAVVDNGRYLGMISKTDGTFTENVFEYEIDQNYYSHNAYLEFGSNETKYYTLPENDFELLNATIELQHVECDNESGSAIIQASGGVAPYTIEVKINGTIINDLFTYNETDHTFTATGLADVSYSYQITDSDIIPCVWDSEFTILDLDPYTYEENRLIIGQNNQGDPTLDDFIWDMDDNFPNNTIMFKHGFVLTGGVTLTINDLRLEFDQQWDAKVIIEPGSKLIVNHSTLTNYHCAGDAKWTGIEVWGDPTFNQDQLADGSYMQGYLEMNSSTIQNAQTAVALRKDGTWAEYGGGIIKADNSQFLNNALSVHFAPYKNMFTRNVNGQTLEFEMLNECEFNKCVFEINDAYFSDSKFFKHADIVQVHRIPFRGCSFILNNTTEDIDTYNCGIAAYSAGVNVDDANDDTPSIFTGFYCAVLSNNSFDNIYYSMIQNSDIINNSVGVRNIQTDNFKIIDNHFEIGENNGGKGICGWAPGYGVDIREATMYVIENNSFIPYQGNIGDNYGIRLFKTATDYTEVYNNEFDNLTVGNLSEGLNTFNGDDALGVAYLCNDHDGNTIDILLTGDVEEEIDIHHDNGSDFYASGNTFSSNATMHIQNDGQEIITFFYNGIQSPDPLRCTDTYIDLDPAANLNTCPDHYGGSGGGIGLDPIGREAKEDEFNGAKTNYNAIKSLYEAYTDGGDTEGTELTIAAALPGDTWGLRSNLFGMSPYLSKEVLKEAANKTEVLPESVLFEILSANPDELRKADLLDYMKNKEQPLPEYMINILKQMATGTSAKTIMIRQMRSYKRDKINAASEIIHSILLEDELDHDDLRSWLANLGSYSGDRQIISSFIDQGDFSSALALLDLLPELYELEGDALTEHSEWADLMKMQLNWQTEGRNPTNLTEAELSTLYNFAENGGTKAKYQARGILEHFYGENYIDCCSPPNGNKSTVADFTKNDLAKAMGLSIEANPNPAKEYTEFTYTLPFGVDNAVLNVFDITGKLIEQKQLNSPINKTAYNTSNLPAGSYTIEIQTKEYSYSAKLIVQ